MTASEQVLQAVSDLDRWAITQINDAAMEARDRLLAATCRHADNLILARMDANTALENTVLPLLYEALELLERRDRLGSGI